MNIREHVSGAIIVNREFLKGSKLKSGVFEHMTLIPGGRSRYCGNAGCVDAYRSTNAPLSETESLPSFFTRLGVTMRNARPFGTATLSNLASSINNLHMFIDYLVIIGGTITPYLRNAHIPKHHQIIYDNTTFPTDHPFIRPSPCLNSSLERGAALYYVKNYL